MKQHAQSVDLNTQYDKNKTGADRAGLCKTCCAFSESGRYLSSACMAITNYGAGICPRLYEAQNAKQ